MAGIKEEKKIYLVGIYCRLSKDDGTDNESASIATQKSILTDYVKKQGWHIAKTYVDDHPHGLCEKAGMAHSKNVCGRWLFWYKFPKTKFPEYDKRH